MHVRYDYITFCTGNMRLTFSGIVYGGIIKYIFTLMQVV